MNTLQPPTSATRRRIVALVLLVIGTSACTKLQSLLPEAEDGATAKRVDAPEAAALEVVASAVTPPSEHSAPTLEFDLARRYSTAHYDAIVARSIDVETMARDVKQATVDCKLRAVERDFFFDDNYPRSGELVLLEEKRGLLIAFATRRSIDIQYPTPKEHVDGWGATDWGSSFLAIGDGGELRLQVVDSRPSAVPRGKVYYRGLGKSDIAILYFNRADIGSVHRSTQTLGMPHGDAQVEHQVEEATNMFGKKFVLVTEESWDAVLALVPQRDIATQVLEMASGRLLGLYVTTKALRPLFGPAAGSAQKLIIEKATEVLVGEMVDLGDRIEAGEYQDKGKKRTGRSLKKMAAAPRHGDALAPKGMPDAVRFAASPVSETGAFALTSAGTSAEARLTCVAAPTMPEEREAISSYLQEVATDESFQAIALHSRKQPTSTLVLLPGENMTLNLELLAHGLARLDVSDTAAARAYPELASAAAHALLERRGFAAAWSEDAEYRAAVQRLVALGR